MTLTIPSYEQAEQAAVQQLPNRVVESFAPYHFTKVGYPTRITAEHEIYKYADAMHEGELDDHIVCLGGLTQEEWASVRSLTEQVWGFSSRDGWPVLARAALLRGIHTLRHLRALYGDQRPRILELGPGSGYLGALLVRLGYPYAAMDNAQGFYLYQHRLWNELFDNKVVELADAEVPMEGSLDSLEAGRPVHVPWWRYVSLRPDTPVRFDVVICNRVLCEMHPTSLNVNLRLARAFLGGAKTSHKLLFFDGWGADIISTPPKVTTAILKAGFTPASDDRGITIFTPTDLRPPFTPAMVEASMRALQHVDRGSEMVVIHDLFRAALPNAVSEALSPKHIQPASAREIGSDEIIGFYARLTGREDHRNPDEAFWDAASLPYFMTELIPTDRPLALFGAGLHGKHVLRTLGRFHHSVSFLLDNDSRKWGCTVEGLKVHNPSEIPPGTFVVIASSWAHEIQPQLMAKGLVPELDILIWPTWL